MVFPLLTLRAAFILGDRLALALEEIDEDKVKGGGFDAFGDLFP
jgi:hypothetical protein